MAGLSVPAGHEIQGRSLWDDARRRLFANKAAVTSMFVLAFVAALAGFEQQAIGFAVLGGLALLLFFVLLALALRWPLLGAGLLTAALLAFDGALLLANLPKIVHGGWFPLLVALGVRTTGEKVVLAMRLVGDEQTAAWAQLLEDLTHRGLRRPQVVLSDGSKGAAAALERSWSGIAHQRCLVHKLRNLTACVPRALRGAVVRDFQAITTATSPAAVHAALAHFRRTWGRKWSAVVVSLDEAGATLTTFTAFPVAQWKCLRTTNAIERIFTEFRRRTKTQGVLPTPEAVLTVLWGTLATGGIRLRKLHGYRTITDTTLRQAA